jgi:ribosomal-protein-alanine N-acetyltransferase
MIPTIQTERLTLSPATAGDLDALLALWTDPDVRRFLWDDREVSREEASEVLEECVALSEDGLGLWIVRVGDEDALAGCVGLRPADPPPQIEPLAAFHPAHWGSGYATEALRALLDHAFATLGLPELAATVDVPNDASRRLVERLGFRRTEEVRGPKHRMIRYALKAPG